MSGDSMSAGGYFCTNWIHDVKGRGANVNPEKSDQLRSDICLLLAGNLGLPSASIDSHPNTRILGAIPEMDSMSVVSILVGLEEQYGIVIHDDEIDAAIFETIGSLSNFIESKLD